MDRRLPKEFQRTRSPVRGSDHAQFLPIRFPENLKTHFYDNAVIHPSDAHLTRTIRYKATLRYLSSTSNWSGVVGSSQRIDAGLLLLRSAIYQVAGGRFPSCE